ncbi:MAG TPA: adenylate/guanylate cyclase domain-containing protein [Chthoniobacterales bacterium]|nr:adenylate/guanylate cyclase domain-containing protein [Chthoniobacterales bacterium]
MKRSLAIVVAIGLVAAAVAALLHATGVLRPIEQLISGTTVSLVSEVWVYLAAVVLAVLTAWLTANSLHRIRIGWLVAGLALELLAAAWVCMLYGVRFQPLPAIIAIALAFVGTERWLAFARRSRTQLARTFFADRLSPRQIRRLVEGDIPLEIEPRTHEVTIVVCDIANKYDMAEESEPGVFAEATEKFIRRTSDVLLEAGGFIQAADGEGVVAIFGFPDGSADHADKAVRVTLDLVEEFRKQESNGDLAGKCDVHLGVSSGTLIVAPLQNGSRPGLLTTGEPMELARRFCVANRFYGSRILIGPRTFELASKNIVARPIDFLSGVNSQERHEIYEPLWLAAEAKPEHIARRDFFWNGVVLYREKRWAEAYTEFQKARAPDHDDDPPLQLYLRRLETLALHLTTAPE